MKIKITGCSDPLMWYADKIDKEFYVLNDDQNEYLVRTGAGDLNIVLKKDCIVYDNPEEFACFMTKENFEKYNNL